MQGLEDCIPQKHVKQEEASGQLSFGPKLRKRGSSVTPKGIKVDKVQEER